MKRLLTLIPVLTMFMGASFANAGKNQMKEIKMKEIKGIEGNCKTGEVKEKVDYISLEEYQKKQQEAEKAMQKEEQEKTIKAEMQRILREQAIENLKKAGKIK